MTKTTESDQERAGRWKVERSDSEPDTTIASLLVPVRSDNPWFHTHILNEETGAELVQFIKHRIIFQGASGQFPMGLMVATFRRDRVKASPRFQTIDLSRVERGFKGAVR